MSFFNVFRRAKSGSKGGPDHRRFNLESLEERCLLSVNAGFVGDAPAATGADHIIDTDVDRLLIQIGDTQQGLTEDTVENVTVTPEGRLGELMVQIDAFLTNGFSNSLAVDNSGTIGAFNFETSSSVYKMLQTAWATVMVSTPVPTQQELYYYYYDGETAASNPFNTGSDENITAFLNILQSGGARQQTLANQIIARMKGMHDVAGVTTLTAVNNQSGMIGEGLDKLWGFGGGVTFMNYGTINCDIDSTDGQGADYFLNDGGTMQGFASGSTDDMFQTFGGAINGDVSLGDGSDMMFVFDTTAFGGEIAFGDGFDTLMLWGSALGPAGTVFSAALADTPEQITIYDVSANGGGEATVTIDTAIPDTDVIIDFSAFGIDAYGEYGVAIGANGDLSAVSAYTVFLNADAVLGNGDGKVVIFSGATADNFNMDAELTFTDSPYLAPSFDTATLTIGGADTLVIGGYEYSLLYDGADVYLQRTSGPVQLPDLIPWSVSAVDYYTDEVLDIDGGTIGYDNLAHVTVTYKNIGDAAVENRFFYSAVRVKNTDTGEYVVFNQTGEDLTLYERISPGRLAVGGESTFRFLIPKLEAGNYAIEIYINNRHDTEKDNWVVESNYDNNYREVFFSVEGSAPLADLVPVSVSAVDYYTGEELGIGTEGAVISPDNLANVTVTYRNDGEAAVEKRFFYSIVSVRNADTGEYVLKDYERISPGNQAVGGEGSFKFLIPKLEVGNYVIEIDINNRHDTEKDNWVVESDYTNNHMEVSFSVDGEVAKADLTPISIAAVDHVSGNALNLDGGTITTRNLADVTATFQNIGEATVANTFFYSAVRVTNTDTGAYVYKGSGIVDGWYERYCKGLEQAHTGTGSFTFKLPSLPVGNYTVEVWVNHRGETQGDNYVDESDYSNNKVTYGFSVAAAADAALPEVFADEAFVDGLLLDF